MCVCVCERPNIVMRNKINDKMNCWRTKLKTVIAKFKQNKPKKIGSQCINVISMLTIPNLPRVSPDRPRGERPHEVLCWAAKLFPGSQDVCVTVVMNWLSLSLGLLGEVSVKLVQSGKSWSDRYSTVIVTIILVVFFLVTVSITVVITTFSSSVSSF
jgi:hypothetical protein